MSEFETYIDDLAKQGLIDGNLCEKITSAHKKALAMNGKEYAVRRIDAWQQNTGHHYDNKESALIEFNAFKLHLFKGDTLQLLSRNVGEWQVVKEATK